MEHIGNLGIVSKLTHVERSKDKERNINKKLKTLHELNFNEK